MGFYTIFFDSYLHLVTLLGLNMKFVEDILKIFFFGLDFMLHRIKFKPILVQFRLSIQEFLLCLSEFLLKEWIVLFIYVVSCPLFYCWLFHIDIPHILTVVTMHVWASWIGLVYWASSFFSACWVWCCWFRGVLAPPSLTLSSIHRLFPSHSCWRNLQINYMTIWRYFIMLTSFLVPRLTRIGRDHSPCWAERWWVPLLLETWLWSVLSVLNLCLSSAADCACVHNSNY